MNELKLLTFHWLHLHLTRNAQDKINIIFNLFDLNEKSGTGTPLIFEFNEVLEQILMIRKFKVEFTLSLNI